MYLRPQPRRRTAAIRLLVAAATVIGLTFSGISAAAAVPATGGDGGQPLPGYTISNPTLPPLSVAGQTTTVVQGVYKHAAFDLEIPPNWNGELVMWAHGYRGTGTVLTVDPPAYGLRETFAQEGYAWAASSYAENNYNPATGVTSTHDLAKYAAKLIGQKPTRTYIVGVSMGGHVIGRSLEEYPKFYAGALPMCGVLGDNRLFDFFLSYNLVAQTLAGTPAYPTPADYQTAVVPQIQTALGLVGLQPGLDTTNELGNQLRDVTINLTGGPRPGAVNSFAIWKDFLFTLASPDNGGTLAQNAGRVATNVAKTYTPNAPVDINAAVPRVFPADVYSRYTPRLIQIPRILGYPKIPVLTLHGLGDMFVPFSMEQLYRNEVTYHGLGGNLVQRAIREAGHCEFTPTEVGQAWTDLTAWVEKGPSAKPAGDDVVTPSVLSNPTYGCRFTDPGGYATPATTPTRALYARCPTG